MISPDEREDVRVDEIKIILKRLNSPEFGHSQDCCENVKNLLHRRIADLVDKTYNLRKDGKRVVNCCSICGNICPNCNLGGGACTCCDCDENSAKVAWEQKKPEVRNNLLDT